MWPVSIVSSKKNKIQGMHHVDKGHQFDVDVPLKTAKPEEFDAKVIEEINEGARRSETSPLVSSPRGIALLEFFSGIP